MGQPEIAKQTDETGPLAGMGAHEFVVSIALPKNQNGDVILSGMIEVRLVVHDSTPTKDIRWTRRDCVTVSAGVVVASSELFDHYRHPDWIGIATPTYVIADGSLVGLIDAPAGANVDASTWAWMMAT
jgi:hypothetical protein